MSRQIPGVLFDVDGTLLDTNYLHVVAWTRALRSAGHPDVPMAAVHRAIGIASEGLLERLIGASDDSIIESHSTEFERLREEAGAFPRVADLLSHCRRVGLTVVLATSAGAADLDWMLPAIGADDAIAGSVTSDDVDASKLAPDLLRTAITKFRLDPARTVAIGDTVWDVESATKAGVPCIGLATGGIDHNVLTTAGAVQVYATSADLLDAFDESHLASLVR